MKMIAYDKVCERKEIIRVIDYKQVDIIFFFSILQIRIWSREELAMCSWPSASLGLAQDCLKFRNVPLLNAVVKEISVNIYYNGNWILIWVKTLFKPSSYYLEKSEQMTRNGAQKQAYDERAWHTAEMPSQSNDKITV